MAKKQYKAETKRLLDLVINSIYTHKEIFIRELISNASDALDKLNFLGLSEAQTVDRSKLEIWLEVHEAQRSLTIRDNGIGMTLQEVEDNLGVIAKSGSRAFKQTLSADQAPSDIDIIGQFGVGFYSAFMVAKKVEVVTQSAQGGPAVRFESSGEDGYRIEEVEARPVGTTLTLQLKDDSDDENYSDYLKAYTLRRLIKKYSDYIRYPIKMMEEENSYDDDGKVSATKLVEKTLNSMVPLWKRAKSELKDEDYNAFYQAKFSDYQNPSKVIHTNLEGALSFDALMFIPSHVPYNFYSSEYEAGLQLYSRGVFILENAKELLPDAFRFVKGLVDSPDLSLNISREMLQHDRQLKVIAARLEKKIKSELLGMLKTDREAYESFWGNFGLQIKYGAYANFGQHKELLQDLLLFYSSRDQKRVTLEEYVARMPEDQKEIYYVSGDSVEKCALLPQTEWVREKGYEILYLVDDVDEFVLSILNTFQDKPFKAINQGELDLASDEEKEALKSKQEENKDLLKQLKEALKDQVVDVRISTRLKTHPVCLVADEGVSLEMEKVLAAMPNQGMDMKAKRILELNSDHPLMDALKKLKKKQVQNYAKLLYNQALLIEGFTLEDPVEFSNQMAQLMIDANR
jgi:molecular chaperone HtpG